MADSMAQGQTVHSHLGPVRYQAVELPLDPDDQVEATIGLMGEYALEDSHSPQVQQLAKELMSGLTGSPQDCISYCQRVWELVHRSVQFVLDAQVSSGAPDVGKAISGLGGEVVEILIRPRDLLAAPSPIGDCDDFSMLAASLILAGGIPCRFATVDGDGYGYWSHVYLVAYPHGKRLPLDTSHGPYPGWETTRNQRLKEWKMLIPTSMVSAGEVSGGINGLGFDWSMFKDLVNSGIATAGSIFKARYAVPDIPAGTTYRAPDGTVISSGLGPGLLNPSDSGISTGTLLVVGAALAGLVIMTRK